MWRNTSFDEGNKQFIQKKFSSAQLEIVLNFHYFCKVCPCWISVKNSNFQKLPKIVEKHLFWWKEQIILPKNIFLTQFEMVLNFHYFCKVRACWIFCQRFKFPKIVKIVEKHFFWWKEQLILPKNIFLAQFQIVLNFHYFCKVPACWIFCQKFKFPKIAYKIVEKHFFDEGSKEFIQKIFASHNLR